MDRRRFLLTSLAGAFAAPVAAEAQQPGGIRHIGVLSASSPESSREAMDEFRRGLRERGYVEGQNIQIEYRWAEGKATRLPELALELISLKPELIVAVASPAARAVHEATRTIPIVIVGVGNPVALGLAASLARPGGNVTGLTSSGLDLNAKQLELLREAVPDMKRLAVMWTPTNPLHEATVRDLEGLTRSRGIQIQSVKIVSPDEIEGGVRAAAAGRAGAVWVVGDPMFFIHRTRLATVAIDVRLPTSFFGRGHVEAGGLIAYAPDYNRLHWQAASYIDKMLNGAKAAELPMQDPTKFELVINLKTAKALGLTIPPSLLARADQVIE